MPFLFKILKKSHYPTLFIIAFLMMLAGYALAEKQAWGQNQEHTLKSFMRPPSLSFPVVFYLSMDHPGPQKAISQTKNRTLSPQLKQDDEITLPIYLGYLVVNNSNEAVFVSKISSYPAISSQIDHILLQHKNVRADGTLCSGEQPQFCAQAETWNAVWILLNDFWRNGIFVSAWSTGISADQYFVPNFTHARNEKQRLASVLYPDRWPDFSNQTYGMKAFKQAWDLPIYAGNWEQAGETVHVRSEKAAPMQFPLVFYFSLTAQGVHRHAPKNPEYKGLNAPCYAGYLIVDKSYTYRFTRKAPFSISLTTMTNSENSHKPGENSEFTGLYNTRFVAPAHTWAGLGLFLAKVAATGDYEIFAYSSGKTADYNFNPAFAKLKPVRDRDNIAGPLQLYANADMLNKQAFPGLDKFNSIMFFEPDWPERWAKGDFAPSLRHTQP